MEREANGRYQISERIRTLCEQISTLPDDGVQAILDSIPPATYEYLKEKRPGFFIPIQPLVRANGYVVNGYFVEEFVNWLRNDNIPCGRIETKVVTKKGPQNYTLNFILGKDSERALASWDKSIQLQEYKKSTVYQICGPQVLTLPKSTDLLKGNGFVRVGKVFKEVGIYVAGHQKFHTLDFLSDDCPVTIFGFQLGFCCRKEDIDQLKEFIKVRALELASDK